MDETGLNRLEPDATLATGPVKGKKKNKERITVALCANATGMDKQKPLERRGPVVLEKTLIQMSMPSTIKIKRPG